ncbi:Prostatic acid phosphatase (chloroplast) [Gracilaria domingensis]|uniref:acyl carrier protein n=1 Tax=Gracilaria domingensis TaxID=172961 RepID=UPI001D102DC6|nr:acyl carrier protein [Gracilaria domingensis]KAI0556386.1 Prostatic acid phosphatase [Gracilaria domingensis]UAD85418.1 acyl carrier protein [Gracilaria domingensis]
MKYNDLYTSVTNKVLKIVSEQSNIDPKELDQYTDFTNYIEDSLEIVEMIMAFEEEFGIDIPDEDSESMFRIKDVIAYIAAALWKDTK